MKVFFDESKVGQTLTDDYGIPPAFRVFRYAYRENADAAAALFVVSFQLKGMDGKKNIRFSRIPMRALFRFRGFLSKYWLLDEATNTCMGVYRWATVEDAERYARSIAMRFMKMRSVFMSPMGTPMKRREAFFRNFHFLRRSRNSGGGLIESMPKHTDSSVA